MRLFDLLYGQMYGQGDPVQRPQSMYPQMSGFQVQGVSGPQPLQMFRDPRMSTNTPPMSFQAPGMSAPQPPQQFQPPGMSTPQPPMQGFTPPRMSSPTPPQSFGFEPDATNGWMGGRSRTQQW